MVAPRRPVVLGSAAALAARGMGRQVTDAAILLGDSGPLDETELNRTFGAAVRSRRQVAGRAQEPSICRARRVAACSRSAVEELFDVRRALDDYREPTERLVGPRCSGAAVAGHTMTSRNVHAR